MYRTTHLRQDRVGSKGKMGILQEVSVRVKSLRYLPPSFFAEEREREKEQERASKDQHDADEEESHRRHERRVGTTPVLSWRCLRAQATVDGVTRDSGMSVWGRGTKAQEAQWLRGGDTLAWRLTDRAYREVRGYHPKLKVHIFSCDVGVPTMDTSESVGWFVVDLRDVAGLAGKEKWVKLRGCDPAEVCITASLRVVKDEKPKKERVSVSSEQPLRVITPSVPPAAQASTVPLPAAEAVADLDALLSATTTHLRTRPSSP